MATSKKQARAPRAPVNAAPLETPGEDEFPYSKAATADHVAAAGIVNGMPAEEVEARLRAVMGG